MRIEVVSLTLNLSEAPPLRLPAPPHSEIQKVIRFTEANHQATR